MKRKYCALLLAAIGVLIGVAGERLHPAPLTGGYAETEETPISWRQSLRIEEDGTFLMAFGALSSYIALGTYEAEADMLCCSTYDAEFRYYFSVTDRDTLTCIRTENADGVAMDAPRDRVVQSGTVFRKTA